MLTDVAVRNTKFRPAAYKLTDGKGLYLLVRSPSKLWRFDYSWAGRRKTLSLGAYPEVSLAQARSGRDTARRAREWAIRNQGRCTAEHMATSVGASLLSHPNALQLTARSRYPEPPWRWEVVTPDLSLPIDVVRSLGARYLEKPEFDAVIVAGERKGIVGRVKRTGTADNRLAPMVVDGLITHADAARERGTRVLADVGRQALVTLELPMLPTIGLLEPGQLLGVGEGEAGWRGLVRATRVAASWTETLTVRQTVEVERHYL